MPKEAVETHGYGKSFTDKPSHVMLKEMLFHSLPLQNKFERTLKPNAFDVKYKYFAQSSF